MAFGPKDFWPWMYQEVSPRWRWCWVLTIVHFYVFDLTGFIVHFGIPAPLAGSPNYILFPFTLCSLALIEIDKGAGFVKSISWVGDITYSSYLLHFPLQIVFGLAVGYGVLNPVFYLSPLYLAVFFAILIPLSYITFVGFERPAQKMIRNAYRRRTGARKVSQGQ